MGHGQLVKKVNNILYESNVEHVFYFGKITYFERYGSDACSHLGVSHGKNN